MYRDGVLAVPYWFNWIFMVCCLLLHGCKHSNLKCFYCHYVSHTCLVTTANSELSFVMLGHHDLVKVTLLFCTMFFSGNSIDSDNYTANN